MLYRKKFVFLIIFTLKSLFLISCITRPNTAEPLFILTETNLPQATSIPLNLPTDTPTPTKITPPPTISGVSTFLPEKAYLELEDLLKYNCELPCFAGITPGETLLIDASKTLFPFGSISDWNSLYEKGGAIGIDYTKEGLILNLFFQIDSSRNSNKVQLFRVFSQALQKIEEGSYYQRMYDAKLYHEVFSKYSLQRILSTHGHPKEIYMTVEINEAEYDSPDFVLLWLVYPQKGFIAKYTANAYEVDGIVHGCLSKAFVNLWLFPPYKIDLYKEELLAYDQELAYIFPVPSPRTKSISDGMNMTIDEFYQIYSQPIDKCLETPSSNWPNWWR
ncbi:MAG: hypothetical protein JNJ43_01245 [Anaerolineales bacterium]|nr:hypothetical protein [Anaerolineales bacterium]